MAHMCFQLRFKDRRGSTYCMPGAFAQSGSLGGPLGAGEMEDQ